MGGQRACCRRTLRAASRVSSKSQNKHDERLASVVSNTAEARPLFVGSAVWTLIQVSMVRRRS